MPGRSIAIDLDGSPYTIDATGQHVLEDAAKLRERADLLARLPDGAMVRLEPSEVARRVAEAVVDSLVAD